jgi:hypothetical protein
MEAIATIASSTLLLSSLVGSQVALSAEPLRLTSRFDPDAVKWVEEQGNSSVQGEAFLKLEDGTWKGCAGLGVELLPVAEYSSERIFKTYGNNERGQILLEQNPPKFTPDAEEYHKMVLHSQCDAQNAFLFRNVGAGEYYVIAFIIWDINQGGVVSKAGGGVMRRIKVEPGASVTVDLKVSE